MAKLVLIRYKILIFKTSRDLGCFSLISGQILSLDWLPFQNHLEFKTEISKNFFFWGGVYVFYPFLRSPKPQVYLKHASPINSLSLFQDNFYLEFGL